MKRIGNYSRHGSRRYSLDESFFSEVTDETRAYWLGFITADGGIIRNDRTYSLRVELSVRDADHLNKMKEALGSNRPISFRETTICAAFDSWQLLEDLDRLGVGPRKSATVKPWAGPEHLMPHYWRGLFDGDGSIFQGSRDGTWTLNQSGSEFCVRAFSDWAKNICGSRAKPRHVRGGCWSWAVEGGPKPKLLAQALYSEASVSLHRKQVLADRLIATDFVAARILSEKKRAEAIREAWTSGRHSRAKARQP